MANETLQFQRMTPAQKEARETLARLVQLMEAVGDRPWVMRSLALEESAVRNRWSIEKKLDIISNKCGKP